MTFLKMHKDYIKCALLDQVFTLTTREKIPESNSMLSHANKFPNNSKLKYYSSNDAVILSKESFNHMSSLNYYYNDNSVYYLKLKYIIQTLIDDFNKYVLNERQLIYSNPSDCISLIHIIPTMYIDKLNLSRELISYNVFIYQRSAYVETLKDDIAFINDMFNTVNCANITYVINNVHYLIEANHDTF